MDDSCQANTVIDCLPEVKLGKISLLMLLPNNVTHRCLKRKKELEEEQVRNNNNNNNNLLKYFVNEVLPPPLSITASNG